MQTRRISGRGKCAPRLSTWTCDRIERIELCQFKPFWDGGHTFNPRYPIGGEGLSPSLPEVEVDGNLLPKAANSGISLAKTRRFG
jgi:hypothetical protein